jgi:GNAT superfamily N-acetyltransferase
LPEDGKAMKRFLDSCSARTRYLRYGEVLAEIPPDEYIFFMDADHQSTVTVVAVDASEGDDIVVSAAKFHINHETGFAEFSMVVQDSWQGEGVGTMILDYLIGIARDMGVKGFEAFVISENQGMIKLIHHLPYALHSSLEGDQYFYRFEFDKIRSEDS